MAIGSMNVPLEHRMVSVLSRDDEAITVCVSLFQNSAAYSTSIMR
jgi:hypothetical protein